VAQSKEQSIEVVGDIKGRMAEYGREPHDLKIIPGIAVGAVVRPQRVSDRALLVRPHLRRGQVPALLRLAGGHRVMSHQPGAGDGTQF
jgi:hypothetical protein